MTDVPRTVADAPPIKRIRDLLTPDEQQQLDEDLAKMARLRRRAEAECANWPMP